MGVLFPAQPRPYLEHGIINEGVPAMRPMPATRPTPATQPTPRRPHVAPTPTVYSRDLEIRLCTALCPTICSLFDLDNNVRRFAQSMVDHLTPYVESCGPTRIACVCVYMASHVMGQPHSLFEIEGPGASRRGEIGDIYRHVYPDRENLIDAGDLERRGYVDILGALRALPSIVWPPLEGA
ncbi:MAG: transcription initiation factor IIB [Alectoria sarmentosa]|nr:MAG: transcription initiation factor IIB [Alectoria sarmentosa]